MGNVLDNMMSATSNTANTTQPDTMQAMTTDPLATEPGSARANDINDLLDQARNLSYGGSQYDSQLQNILDTIQNSKYESAYTADIQDLIASLKNGQFQYSTATDPGFQEAQKVAQRQTFEEMASRGILPSTVTADRLSQSVAELTNTFRNQAYTEWRGSQQDKFNLVNTLTNLDQVAYSQFRDQLSSNFSLAGYYKDLADTDYNRFVDEVNNLYRSAEFLNQLDMQDYQKYQDAITNEYNQSVFDFEKEQQALQNERTKIADAWSRVESLGYVDNAAAEILGVEPGTLSQGAREAKQKLDNEILLMDKELANNIKYLQAQYAQQRSLIESNTIQSEVDAWNSASQEQKAYYNSLKKWMEYQVGLGNTDESMDYLTNLSQKSRIIQKLGEPLYNSLIALTQSAIDKKNPQKPVTSSMGDYDSVYQEARNFVNNYDSQTALNIVENSDLTPEQKNQLKAQLGLGSGATSSGMTNTNPDIVSQSASNMATANDASTYADSLISQGYSAQEVIDKLDSLGWVYDANSDTFSLKKE